MYSILYWISEDLGGGVALAVLVIACIIAVKFGKGIISWVAVGILSLIMLNHIMVRFENPLRRAISDFIILMGLSALTVQNIIAIITGKYWNIKTNSIFGGICLALGFIVSAVVS